MDICIYMNNKTQEIIHDRQEIYENNRVYFIIKITKGLI